MTRPPGAIGAEWFTNLYRADPDPWKFATSDYERDKYAATLRALGRARYGRVFEVGCANGVFTKQLAARADSVLAVDVVPQVLEAARLECVGLRSVEFRHMSVPDELPDAQFDLITLCEVGYYWDKDGLERFAHWVADALSPGGELILVHWTGETDYPLSADAVHDTIIRLGAPRLQRRVARREEKYRLDCLRRLPKP